MDYFDFAQPEFLDPADWSLASYSHHPVDDLEPLLDDPTPYRTAALECLRILAAVDLFVSRERDTRLAWVIVSITIGLESTAGLTEAEIARQIGVSELSVRRAVTKFTRLANLDPAGGFQPLGQIRSNGSALKENGQRGL